MTDSILLLRHSHVFIGVIAFFAGAGAMLTPKGGLWHRRCGKIYFASMVGVTGTAILISIFGSASGAGFFFFLLSILSMYSAFSGYRVVHLRRRGKKPGVVDWLPVILSAAAGFVLIVGGIRFIFERKIFAPVLLMIGTTAALLAAADIRRFTRVSSERNEWWVTHMSRMIASYIAIVTAVSVINFRFLPVPVRWLWPSVIGFTGLFIWIRRRRASVVPRCVR